MCEELQNGSLPLLILTPNGREEAGTNRDCFILNPDASDLKMFQFLGVLMGIAIRTGSPLSLNLAEPVWKALVTHQNPFSAFCCCFLIFDFEFSNVFLTEIIELDIFFVFSALFIRFPHFEFTFSSF